MRFKVNLKAATVDPRQKVLLEAFVRDSTVQAARLWVRAAVDKIPVWSGASRATLQNLASAVGEHIDIDVKGNVDSRIGLGRLHSQGGIEKTGELSWTFFYETQLRYLIANETERVAPRTRGLFGSLIEPTPYEFREAGNRAVDEYIATLIVPILKLKGISL